LPRRSRQVWVILRIGSSLIDWSKAANGER
jgi:hypothetical protein